MESAPQKSMMQLKAEKAEEEAREKKGKRKERDEEEGTDRKKKKEEGDKSDTFGSHAVTEEEMGAFPFSRCLVRSCEY